MENLLILGAGGFGSVMEEIARECGQYRFISFLDDAASRAIGKCIDYQKDEIRKRYTAAYPAFGNNGMRVQWIERLITLGYQVPVFVHPRAYAAPSAQMGAGTVLLPGAVVNTDCTLGRGCIVNLGALVDHNTVLEDGVHLAPGAIVKANQHIEAQRKIESGVVVGIVKP